jgi:hypothetical protein
MELDREKHWARIHLVSILQAETDRDMVRRLDASESREYDAMKDTHPDWSPMDLKVPVFNRIFTKQVQGVGKNGKFDMNQAEPVYHTKRHVMPNFVILDAQRSMPAQWWRGSKVFLKNAPYHERKDFEGENPNY